MCVCVCVGLCVICVICGMLVGLPCAASAFRRVACKRRIACRPASSGSGTETLRSIRPVSTTTHHRAFWTHTPVGLHTAKLPGSSHCVDHGLVETRCTGGSTWASECGVQHLGPVRRRQQYHALPRLKTVQLGEQGVECLFPAPATCACAELFRPASAVTHCTQPMRPVRASTVLRM